jgi:hypothetical protein
MKNVAIKCTSPEQGAKIIEYLVKRGGRNIIGWDGSDVWSFYFINESGYIDFADSIPSGYTEIKLPSSEAIGPEGKLMWVWNGDGENPKNGKCIVLWIGEKLCMSVIPNGEDGFRHGLRVNGVCWDHCAEIDEEPEVMEVTMAEVCAKFGMNVKIVKE